MRKFTLFLFLLVPFYFVKADAGLGGEILLKHISGSQYQLTCNLYRSLNGSIAWPLELPINAFARGTGSGIPSNISSQPQNHRPPGCTGSTFCLPKVYDSIVMPRNTGCQTTLITAEKWVYMDTITLGPTVFSDPSGYVLSTPPLGGRSGLINNLNMPASGSNSLRVIALIPPVIDGTSAPIINSSPSFGNFISEYGCTQRLYSHRLGGLDPDGDSIAYQLLSPTTGNSISTGSITALHSPYVDPMSFYPSVSWITPYSGSDQILGASGPPDPAWDRLRINANSGDIVVTPRISGIFTYGLAAYEYRDLDGNGSKELIAATYREFVLSVFPTCPSPDTLDGPVVGKPITHIPGDTLAVPAVANQRTVFFRVWDSDYDPLDPIGRQAEFFVETKGFADSLVSLSPNEHTFISQFDTVLVGLTFDPCAYSGSIPYEFSMVTRKGHCPIGYPDSTTWFALVDSLSCAPETSNISGTISLGGSADPTLTGEAFLLKPVQGQTGPWQFIAYSSINQSAFRFDSIPQGDYFVHANLGPTDPNYGSYFPSYYVSEINWANADRLSLYQDTGITIDLVQAVGPSSGPGLIDGEVVWGANSTNPGAPLEGIAVQLLSFTDELLTSVLTNSNGYYSIDNLGLASYKLRVEVPGVAHTGESLTLTSANPDQYFKFLVNDNSVVLSGLDDHYLRSQISIFPNPVNDILHIRTGEIRIEDLNISIQDVQGKTIGEFHGRSLLDLGNIDPGIYFLNIADQDSRLIRKLIIR